jgi:voltage-gated potassium channel
VYSLETLKHNFKYFKKLYYAAGLIVALLITGITGYMSIEGHSFLDAFFMTVNTIATVGYKEIGDLSNAGKIFTMLLIFLSISTFAYAVSVITRYVIEGEFQTYFKHYKVNKEVSKLENHIIVCGYGRNGKQACEQLRSQNEPFVAVEMNHEIISTMREEGNILFIEGDATKDETLTEAGITKAKALISALPDDAANVFVVLTARGMNPRLKIISRASDESSELKLKRAGADNVIMPDKIGGTHMASLVVKPDVLEFLDFITEHVQIKLEEIPFSTLPESLQHQKIGDLLKRNVSGTNLVGIKTANGQYLINPTADVVMEPGAKLFVLGTQEQVMKLKESLRGA